MIHQSFKFAISKILLLILISLPRFAEAGHGTCVELRLMQMLFGPMFTTADCGRCLKCKRSTPSPIQKVCEDCLATEHCVCGKSKSEHFGLIQSRVDRMKNSRTPNEQVIFLSAFLDVLSTYRPVFHADTGRFEFPDHMIERSDISPDFEPEHLKLFKFFEKEMNQSYSPGTEAALRFAIEDFNSAAQAQ